MALLDRIGSELAYVRGAIRALRRTTPIAKHRSRTVRDLAEDSARRFGDRIALVGTSETFTYRAWNGRANRIARFALGEGWRKGDVVALLMPNRPDYLCVWLGIAKMGGVTALLNTNLSGAALAHSIAIVGARAVIVDARLLDAFDSARPHLKTEVALIVHGAGDRAAPRLDTAMMAHADTDLVGAERVPLTIDDRCLFIYTSGTTGWPKAANINHYRVQLAMLGFAACTNARASDRIFDVLPMYHTVGGVCTPGAALVVGGTCIIREKFSARDFWADLVANECTMFSYIGELCRYLLATSPSEKDRQHKVRLCFGNGLRPDIWTAFRDRFGLKHILEFYAATEGNVTLFNFDSKPGSVGRIPKWMESRFVVKIVRLEAETLQPQRGADGLCVACAPDEPGEALGQILENPAKPANRFEGYADAGETDSKILRDVFQRGDRWFRSGDLMRKDALGYFSFVDRLGDTFRWKGENVSTTQVAESLTTFPGVREATVYGVAVPGADGRAGMAALVADSSLDLAGLRAHLDQQLPAYARPLFLRLCESLDVTGTFKQRKTDLAAEGFDVHRIGDPVFVDDREAACFVRVEAERHARIVGGAIRF